MYSLEFALSLANYIYLSILLKASPGQRDAGLFLYLIKRKNSGERSVKHEGSSVADTPALGGLREQRLGPSRGGGSPPARSVLQAPRPPGPVFVQQGLEGGSLAASIAPQTSVPGSRILPHPWKWHKRGGLFPFLIFFFFFLLSLGKNLCSSLEGAAMCWLLRLIYILMVLLYLFLFLFSYPFEHRMFSSAGR